MNPDTTWSPPPDESSSAQLPEFLQPLIEHLAEKIHNRWAAKRIEEGWSFGPERNDSLRTTPNLTDYASLPEIEKDYDRATVLATLRNLYAGGYRIVPAAASSAAGEAEAVAVRLENAETLRFESAEMLWHAHTPGFWRENAELLLILARKCSDAGWPLLAFDMTSQTLANNPEKPLPPRLENALRHIAVLSLMEVGALERASAELAKIQRDEWIEGELQGLRGRLAKARGFRAKNPGEAARHFREAREIYSGAYKEAHSRFLRGKSRDDGAAAYYLGINAATMSAWAGLPDEARTLAGEVLEVCEALSGDAADPWLEATHGEAHLLRSEMPQAAEAYRRAAEALRGQWRPMQSMRRQALITAQKMGIRRAEIESWFKMPVLCVRGFSQSAEESPPGGSVVFYLLRDASQMAEAESICAASAEFHLCLGQCPAAFVSGLTAEESARLEKLMAASTLLLGKENQFVADDPAFHGLAPLLFRGMVLLRAQELDVAPQNLPTLVECVPENPGVLRALLCADVKGYSRLDNNLLEIFVSEYLGCIARVVDGFRDRALTVKMAGDGLFMVFRDLASAVHFSLALRDATCAVDWAAHGMPEDMGLRISLDAGPMIQFTDPVTGRPDVAGRLVNRAARIEPITPVNQVYASRTLAALALAMEIPGVHFEYAGETPLPKGFGAFQLYHLTAA